MKKIISLFLTLILTISCAFLFGCGENKGSKEGCLTIRYFKGGYGDEWIKDSVLNFLSEKKGCKIEDLVEGVDYKLIPDQQVTSNTVNYLKSDNNVPDVLMTQGGFEQYISEGLIANISDVYEMEVSKLDGSKIKIKDYILPQAYESVTRQMKYGTGQTYSWAIPWSAEQFSLAYNEDLLLNTKHNDLGFDCGSDIVAGSNWTRCPKTMPELLAYLADVEKSNDGKSEQEKIIPFGWNYKAAGWFQFLVDIWWAQIQGTTESKIEGEKSFYDFFNFNSLDLLDQTGIKLAYDTLRSIVYDKDGNYINSPSREEVIGGESNLFNHYAALGDYAVWVAGDFFENENKVDLYVDGKPRFTCKLMSLPNAIGSDGEVTTERISFIRTDEAFFIPAKAKNVQLAKEYLAYMCNEKELLNYTKKSGGLRPFDYNPMLLDKDYEWTDFQKSAFSLYNDADEVIIEYPFNVKNAQDISPVYLYNRSCVKFYMIYGFTTMFSDSNKTKPIEQLMEDVKNNINSQFNKWKQQYGVYFNKLK